MQTTARKPRIHLLSSLQTVVLEVGFFCTFSLKSSRSGSAARDIVQFVPFRDFKQVRHNKLYI